MFFLPLFPKMKRKTTRRQYGTKNQTIPHHPHWGKHPPHPSGKRHGANRACPANPASGGAAHQRISGENRTGHSAHLRRPASCHSGCAPNHLRRPPCGKIMKKCKFSKKNPCLFLFGMLCCFGMGAYVHLEVNPCSFFGKGPLVQKEV